jgi:hypothetical protein
MLETISTVSTSEIERFLPSSPFFQKNFFLQKFAKEFATKEKLKLLSAWRSRSKF